MVNEKIMRRFTTVILQLTGASIISIGQFGVVLAVKKPQ